MFRRVEARFYFTPGDADQAARLECARGILGQGEIDEEETHLRNGVTEVVLRANVPEATATTHIFEQRFNKAWPDGCGAGYLGFAEE